MLSDNPINSLFDGCEVSDSDKSSNPKLSKYSGDNTFMDTTESKNLLSSDVDVSSLAKSMTKLSMNHMYSATSQNDVVSDYSNMLLGGDSISLKSYGQNMHLDSLHGMDNMSSVTTVYSNNNTHSSLSDWGHSTSTIGSSHNDGSTIMDAHDNKNHYFRNNFVNLLDNKEENSNSSDHNNLNNNVNNHNLLRDHTSVNNSNNNNNNNDLLRNIHNNNNTSANATTPYNMDNTIRLAQQQRLPSNDNNSSNNMFYFPTSNNNNTTNTNTNNNMSTLQMQQQFLHQQQLLVQQQQQLLQQSHNLPTQNANNLGLYNLSATDLQLFHIQQQQQMLQQQQQHFFQQQRQALQRTNNNNNNNNNNNTSILSNQFEPVLPQPKNMNLASCQPQHMCQSMGLGLFHHNSVNNNNNTGQPSSLHLEGHGNNMNSAMMNAHGMSNIHTNPMNYSAPAIAEISLLPVDTKTKMISISLKGSPLPAVNRLLCDFFIRFGLGETYHSCLKTGCCPYHHPQTLAPNGATTRRICSDFFIKGCCLRGEFCHLLHPTGRVAYYTAVKFKMIPGSLPIVAKKEYKNNNNTGNMNMNSNVLEHTNKNLMNINSIQDFVPNPIATSTMLRSLSPTNNNNNNNMYNNNNINHLHHRRMNSTASNDLNNHNYLEGSNRHSE